MIVKAVSDSTGIVMNPSHSMYFTSHGTPPAHTPMPLTAGTFS